MTESSDVSIAARQRWMAVLAKAGVDELQRLWDGYPGKPTFERVRGPESGLVMVRGRAGGTGAPFNVGEMTVTRCTVRVDAGSVGHAYVAGRSHRHAEIAAVVDALMQDPAVADAVENAVVGPLQAAAAARREAALRKSAATKVDFFTLAGARAQT